MIVPSILNSITACDLLIAAACANASRAAELLFHKGIKKSSSIQERTRRDMPARHGPESLDPHFLEIKVPTLW
jgi:hypothetical protein